MNDYDAVRENALRIKEEVERAKSLCGRSDEVRLMAVTKTVPWEKVNHAASLGFTLLGENRVQEYLSKRDMYAEGTEVHFIGHLQTNKVRQIADKVTMIQSVDSIKLAEEISRICTAQNRRMDILCEVNIGGEESKSGFSPDELTDAAYRAAQLEGIRLCGIMVIPPREDSAKWFERSQRLYEDLRSENIPRTDISVLSMGMSADYAEAVKYGSTMVRIGSALFGERVYR